MNAKRTVNRPHTAHLANEPATHYICLCRVATHRQLARVQLNHLLDAQSQGSRRLRAVHIVPSAGDHMHTGRRGHLSHERQIALQTVRRVLDDAAAAPAAVPAHIVQHAGVRVLIAEAQVVAARVRVLAHESAGLQANVIGGKVFGQLCRRCLVEAVKVQREVLVCERAPELVGGNCAENWWYAIRLIILNDFRNGVWIRGVPVCTNMISYAELQMQPHTKLY